MLVVAALGTALAGPCPALAKTTEVNVYEADDAGGYEISARGAGTPNDMVIQRRGGQFVFADNQKIVVEIGARKCDHLSAKKIRCKNPSSSEINLSGGGGDDRLRLGPTIDWGGHLFGGDGRDRLLGGKGEDAVFGGEKDDVIHGGRGADGLYGDNGKDRIFGEAQNDRLNLSGSGRRDVDPGDIAYGGSGDDRLSTNRNREKIANCGAGKDEAEYERGNRTNFINCETEVPFKPR